MAGTRWIIESVNGYDLSAREDFTISFTHSKFEARFGCRTSSGRYTVEGDYLRTAEVVTDGPSCAETPAEELGPVILNSGMSLSWSGRGLMLEKPPTFIFLRPTR
nr:META domain-containing protein [Qipengyuania qiaonensis]